MRRDRSYCDFLVLAPLHVEVEALKLALDAVAIHSELTHQSAFPTVVEYDLKAGPRLLPRRVVVVQLNQQGVLNAGIDSAMALDFYEAGYVVSFGIAGSLNISDAPIGSVLFGTSLFYYEPSKEGTNARGKPETQSRMDPIPISITRLNDFRALATKDYRLVDGPVASGEKLFANVRSDEHHRILAANNKIIAVEMEAAGVGKAVERLTHGSEFIVFKGISDGADKKKNSVLRETQEANRAIAASNAANCFTRFALTCPLKRTSRGTLGSEDDGHAQAALQEATCIIKKLEPYGISIDRSDLFRTLCLRKGSIPAYYHWRQRGPDLHWIDFKILTALAELPRDTISPRPLVTVSNKSIAPGLRDIVNRVLGFPVEIVTQFDVVEVLNEITPLAHRIGFSPMVERGIRADLLKFQHTGTPEVTLAWMQFMLAQFSHRRMLIFSWKNSSEKWKHLHYSDVADVTMCRWQTINLGNVPGKREAPGRDLVIDGDGCNAVARWFEVEPNLNVLAEFLEQFRCHRPNLKASDAKKSRAELNQDFLDLLAVWNSRYLTQK